MRRTFYDDFFGWSNKKTATGIAETETRIYYDQEKQ